MTLKRTAWKPGTLVVLEHDSRVLRDNPLGDPHVRKLAVWLPPQYDDRRLARPRPPLPGALRPGRLHGLGSLARRLEALRRERARARRAPHLSSRRMGPAIIVFPDCFTALGGNQYVNSSAIGNYADYLTTRDRPVRRPRVPHARLARSPRLLRQVLGRLRLDHPRHEVRAHWGAIADHSGDAYFDFVYCARLAQHAERARQVPPSAGARRTATTCAAHREGRGSTGRDDGRVRRFLETVWKKRQALDGGRPRDHEPLHGRDLRSRSRARRNGFRLPFNLETGELIPERWKNWRAQRSRSTWSRSTAPTCESLHGIYIDCGWRDQYHIQYGSRILSQAARAGAASPTCTRSSTTTTPTSTTGWMCRCRSCIARSSPDIAPEGPSAA